MDPLDGEEFEADYDAPVTVDWLAAVYGAVFSSPAGDDVDLDFDPDDYLVT